MATGTSRSIPPTGSSVTPTSGVSGSSFDLDEKQKRWLVIGICLNKSMLPVLRNFVGQEISKHFLSFKNINKQVYPSHVRKDGSFDFKYRSINNNWEKSNKRSYDYTVKTAEDFGKLYLEPNMAKFSGFDNECDLSAVLNILANASVFPVGIQPSAKKVRSDVRNKWGHCNFDEWTENKFNSCFQLMQTLIRDLALPAADKNKIVDELTDWEKKGIILCMGSPVDKDLMNLVSIEVTNLQQDVEEIKKTRSDEGKKISDSLLVITGEIAKFNERVSKIEKQVEIQGKEQLEKNESMSCEIAGVLSHMTIVEENVAQLEERHNDLATTVSSVIGNQVSLPTQITPVEGDGAISNTAKLSPPEIERLANEIANVWERIARLANLPEGVVGNVARDHVLYQGPSNKAARILEMITKKSKFSRKQLAEFLKEVGYHNLVDPVLNGTLRNFGAGAH